MGPLEKTVYREVLRNARRFDKNVAAKVSGALDVLTLCWKYGNFCLGAQREMSVWQALIQRHGIIRPPLNDLDAIGGDRRLYAAALEVVVGSHCHVKPERLAWSLQRLIRTIRLADENNLEVIADKAAKSEKRDDLADRELLEQDAMAAISIEIFFPGALKGVQGEDKLAAGFAAIRELSSKWALAESLGLASSIKTTQEEGGSPFVKRRRRRPALPRNAASKRAQRMLRHQERHANRAKAAAEPLPSMASPVSSVFSPGLGPQTGLMEPGVFAESAHLVEPTYTPAKGVYLISHPLSWLHAPEEIFHRSVVLLVDHSSRGSYGLVVNKDKGETLEEALCEEAIPLASDALQRVLKNPVRIGGPVMSRLAWLHPHKEVGGVALAEDEHNPVFFCGTMEKASELLSTGAAQPADFSLLVGASSWHAEQLQGELDHGLWIMAKAPASFAVAGVENLWEKLLEAMGGPYAAMARIPHGRHWDKAGAKSSPSDWP